MRKIVLASALLAFGIGTAFSAPLIKTESSAGANDRTVFEPGEGGDTRSDGHEPGERGGSDRGQ